jgi:hypothetical protein
MKTQGDPSLQVHVIPSHRAQLAAALGGVEVEPEERSVELILGLDRLPDLANLVRAQDALAGPLDAHPTAFSLICTHFGNWPADSSRQMVERERRTSF